jgi:hypothetical protein
VKTVKAYEVGGKLFKDKKAAEVEEKELGKKRRDDILVKQLTKICGELGVAVPDLGFRVHAKIMKVGEEFPQCVTGEHKVLTNAGWKPVKEIATGGVTKFSVGDKVKLVNFKGLAGCVGLDGSTGTVSKLPYMPGQTYEVLLDNRHGHIFVAEDNLEKGAEEPKFKVGDRVLFKDPANLQEIGIIVDEASKDGTENRWLVKFTGEHDYPICEKYLELAVDEKPKFKVGDKVTLSKKHMCRDHRGQKGTITSVTGLPLRPEIRACGFLYRVEFRDVPGLRGKSNCTAMEQELEKVGDKPAPKFKKGDKVRLSEGARKKFCEGDRDRVGVVVEPKVPGRYSVDFGSGDILLNEDEIVLDRHKFKKGDKVQLLCKQVCCCGDLPAGKVCTIVGSRPFLDGETLYTVKEFGYAEIRGKVLAPAKSKASNKKKKR